VPRGADDTLVIPSFSFTGFKLADDAARRRREVDASYGYTESELFLASGNQFASHEAIVDPASGLIRLRGVSRPITRGFSFTGITFTLAYPTGRRANAPAGAQQYILEQGASVAVKYAYANAPVLERDAYFLVLLDTSPPRIV